MSRSYKKSKVLICSLCGKASYYILPDTGSKCYCARPFHTFSSVRQQHYIIFRTVYDFYKTMTSSNTGGGKNNQRKFWQRYRNKQLRKHEKVISKNIVQSYNSGHFNDNFKPYPIFKRNIAWDIC